MISITIIFVISVNATAIDTSRTSFSEFDECVSIVLSVYQKKYAEKTGVVSEVVYSIVQQDEFKNAYASEGKMAFRIVEDALQDALELDTNLKSYYSGKYYLPNTVPAIDQYYGSYCGPAATLQALIGNGFLSNTTSNTNSTAVYNMGTTLGTTSSGTYISNITNHMKSYYSSNTLTYNRKAFTQYSYNKALPYVSNSLYNDGAVIMRVNDTSKLQYYNGVSLSHYVTIIEVNYTRSTVKIVDPHYNSTYRGTHTITFTEFNNIMSDDGWLSVLTTDTASNAYSYIY
jgi:hypothetical protein